MKRNASTTATISGKGMFPVDMLRYDRCYPASERDSGVLQRSGERPREPWSVKVSKSGAHEWTVARWQSFGVDIVVGT